ncbi:hypothetical protein K437DRAFT_52983 [Tilletiaria anomala UBC 951]|uniref:PX domain-containing protein n=1 Tax=Tilletiaria anomala (strain ATCC 24038 / CBS 436.72 / UBC 951) TaxID=1037660 RepID=A0A066V8M5_TILAU|nr:uncharacterized protein K437DRAFT_52983 [Tilletiaria anomala UBC 951]KDN36643.1 hypothetical protein K437DRAFT_52983 [Tilletiaria anomala UBC 951]
MFNETKRSDTAAGTVGGSASWDASDGQFWTALSTDVEEVVQQHPSLAAAPSMGLPMRKSSAHHISAAYAETCEQGTTSYSRMAQDAPEAGSQTDPSLPTSALAQSRENDARSHAMTLAHSTTDSEPRPSWYSSVSRRPRRRINSIKSLNSTVCSPHEDDVPPPPPGLARLRKGSSNSSLRARAAASAVGSGAAGAAVGADPNLLDAAQNGSRASPSSAGQASPQSPNASISNPCFLPSLPDLLEASVAGPSNGLGNRGGRSAIANPLISNKNTARYHRPTASLSTLLSGPTLTRPRSRSTFSRSPSLSGGSASTSTSTSLSLADEALASVPPPRPPRPDSDAMGISTRRSRTLDEFMPATGSNPCGEISASSSALPSGSASASAASQGFSSDSDDDEWRERRTTSHGAGRDSTSAAAAPAAAAFSQAGSHARKRSQSRFAGLGFASVRSSLISNSSGNLSKIVSGTASRSSSALGVASSGTLSSRESSPATCADEGHGTIRLRSRKSPATGAGVGEDARSSRHRTGSGTVRVSATGLFLSRGRNSSMEAFGEGSIADISAESAAPEQVLTMSRAPKKHNTDTAISTNVDSSNKVEQNGKRSVISRLKMLALRKKEWADKGQQKEQDKGRQISCELLKEETKSRDVATSEKLSGNVGNDTRGDDAASVSARTSLSLSIRSSFSSIRSFSTRDKRASTQLSLPSGAPASPLKLPVASMPSSPRAIVFAAAAGMEEDALSQQQSWKSLLEQGVAADLDTTNDKMYATVTATGDPDKAHALLLDELGMEDDDGTMRATRKAKSAINRQKIQQARSMYGAGCTSDALPVLPTTALFRNGSTSSSGASAFFSADSGGECSEANTPRAEKHAFDFGNADADAAALADATLGPGGLGTDLERKTSGASSRSLSSSRLGFRHSIFNSSISCSVDGHSGSATPGFEFSYGHAYTTDEEGKGAVATAANAEATGPGEMKQVEYILRSKLAGRDAFAPLDTRGLGKEKKMTVIESPTGGDASGLARSMSVTSSLNSVDAAGRYGANFHIRTGSFRSLAPSLLGSDAASIISAVYEQAPTTLELEWREEREKEENFWSTIGQSQFEAEEAQDPCLPYGTTVLVRPPSVSTATSVRELSLPAQLAHMDDRQKRSLVHELAERELWWEICHAHTYEDQQASFPMLQCLLRSQPGAEAFFRKAILPIAKSWHEKKVSRYVDRHGEGDATRFSAVSTVSCLQQTTVSILAHLYAWQLCGLTPVEEIPQLDYGSMLLLPYRLPVDQLRNGGFEVDIVAARAAAYVLRVRRPSRWDNFIFRTEQHFQILRKNLLKEMGSKVAIPRLPGASALHRPVLLDTASLQLPTSARCDSVGVRESLARPRNAFEADDQDLDSDSDEEPQLDKPRSKAARRLQRAAFAGPAVKHQVPSPKLLNKTSHEGIVQSPRKVEIRSRSDPKKTRIGKPPREPSPPASVQSLNLKSESKLNLSLAEGDELLTTERAARAKDLRRWLRDVLAIRGVGHSHALQSFLVTGKVPEHELKKAKAAVQEALIAQDLKAEERIMSAGRDAFVSGAMQNEVFSLAYRCLSGDELLQIPQFFKSCSVIGQLPRDYQLALKWIASQAAHLAYGIFVAGDESHGNLSRAKELYKMLPWQTLASSMRSPAFAMVKQIQHRLLQRRFVQDMLDLFLQDDPVSIQKELKLLRQRIRSNTVEQKLRRFVEAPQAFKAMVRQSADEAGIPLVVAIVRGSDNPRLNRPTLERIITASKAYKEFMATRPTAVQKNSNTSREYLLVKDLQRMLRLYSLWRDGHQIRSMIAKADVADAIAELCQPITDLLCTMQRVSGGEDSLIHLASWLHGLLDLCEGLRARVQDPARSVAAITEHIEFGFRDGYVLLHQVALEAPDVLPFSRIHSFLHGLAAASLHFHFDGPCAPVSSEQSKSGASAGASNADLGAMAGELESLSRKHLLRSQEIFARWIAGDCEDESSILVIGDLAGKTRKEPFFPRELPAKPHLPQLDQLLDHFRAACKQAFEGS